MGALSKWTVWVAGQRLRGRRGKRECWLGEVVEEIDSWRIELVGPSGALLAEEWVPGNSTQSATERLLALAEAEGAVSRVSHAEREHEFAAFVQRERLARGWSQNYLSRVAGVDHTTVRSIERMEHPARPDTKAKLTSVLGPGEWGLGADERLLVLERRIREVEERLNRLREV